MKPHTHPKHRIIQRGFTLIEISIVLIIIGAIFYGLLKSQAIISSTKAKDVIAKVNDLRTATAYFKQRYGYLPGDLPNPANYILPGLVQGAGGTIGNGTIEGAVSVTGVATAGTETAEVAWQLFNAGFIGAVDSSNPTHYLNTTFGPVHIVGAAIAAGLVPAFAARNPTARNAILFFNLPCDVALEVDNKIDDGTMTLGYGVGSANCINAGTTALPVYALPL